MHAIHAEVEILSQQRTVGRPVAGMNPEAGNDSLFSESAAILLCIALTVRPSTILTVEKQAFDFCQVTVTFMSIQKVADTLASHPDIELAIVFGSVASTKATTESDVDVAIRKAKPMGTQEKLDLISEIADATGRPVDLIDLRTVGEPLLGQILKHGKMILGDADGMAALMQKHVYAMEDFVPYVERTLEERRRTWIG